MHGREDKVIRKNVLADSPWVFYVKIIELIRMRVSIKG